MATLVVYTRSGERKELETSPGDVVMEVIRDSIGEIEALCGGCASCATCHVYVENGEAYELPPPEVGEADLLDGSDFRRENSRLSCQLTFAEEWDGLTVRIAPQD